MSVFAYGMKQHYLLLNVNKEVFKEHKKRNTNMRTFKYNIDSTLILLYTK